MTTQRRSVPFFVKRDLDGFFGLFIDNLVQLLVITELTTLFCGLSREFVYSRILPGAAVSVIVGNLFYSLQAWYVSRKEGRDDVTALPYGINTPSVIGYIFFVMAPVFEAHKKELGPEAAAQLAWQVGLLACLGSGVIEFVGAFIAEPIRKATPRAALIAALAGIALGFISMDFILRVFEHPLLAFVPMGIILTQYFSGARLPLGMPAGLAALLVGTAIGWGLKAFTLWGLFDGVPEPIQRQFLLETASLPNWETFKEAIRPVIALPQPAHEEIMQSLNSPDHWKLIVPYLGVIIPMGLFNLVGSLQNIESAEAAGDRFATMPSLAVNGIATFTAALLGSCFPTTIYIGHVGWKHLGARVAYSWMNGLAIAAICIFGLVRSIQAIVPLESVVGILLWIAVIITAQAFQSVPRRHAPAVALGLIPGIAALCFLFFQHGLAVGGKFLGTTSLDEINSIRKDAHIGGLIALNQGFILTSMGLAAIGVMIIERRFKAGAIWAWIMAVFSAAGIIHSWDAANLGAAFSFSSGWRYAIGYAIWGLILFSLRGQKVVGSGHGADPTDDLDYPEVMKKLPSVGRVEEPTIEFQPEREVGKIAEPGEGGEEEREGSRKTEASK